MSDFTPRTATVTWRNYRLHTEPRCAEKCILAICFLQGPAELNTTTTSWFTFGHSTHSQTVQIMLSYTASVRASSKTAKTKLPYTLYRQLANITLCLRATVANLVTGHCLAMHSTSWQLYWSFLVALLFTFVSASFNTLTTRHNHVTR